MKKKKQLLEVGWKDLPEDILVTIFNKLDKKSLFKTGYSVCKWWRSVCRLLLFWDKNRGYLELARFKNIGFDQGSQLMKLLKRILDGLEHKSEIVTHIELPEKINLSDDFLHYMAQRLPKLIYLQLPETISMITTEGFSRAIRIWGEMNSLRMGSLNVLDYSHIFHEIGINCKNMEALSIYTNDMEMGMKNGQIFVLDEYTSVQISKNLCSMKTLILRQCILVKTGLEIIMSECKCLDTICIIKCRRASMIPKFDCLQTEGTYLMTKRVIKDNTIDWSLEICGDLRLNSTSYILKYLWQFEEEVCDYLNSTSYILKYLWQFEEEAFDSLRKKHVMKPLNK